MNIVMPCYSFVPFLCLDIDECGEGSSGCGQICNNTIGNYSCSCNTGYELGNDSHKCNGNTLLLLNSVKFCLELLKELKHDIVC